jgi:hypothetical protein
MEGAGLRVCVPFSTQAPHYLVILFMLHPPSPFLCHLSVVAMTSLGGKAFFLRNTYSNFSEIKKILVNDVLLLEYQVSISLSRT